MQSLARRLGSYTAGHVERAAEQKTAAMPGAAVEDGPAECRAQRPSSPSCRHTTPGCSIAIDRVREQVETLLAYERDLEAEPSGDVSFRHGSACMHIGVDECTEVRLVVQLMASVGDDLDDELAQRFGRGRFPRGAGAPIPAPA